MSEIEEILKLAKGENVPFPLRVGVLSRSVREITGAGENMLDYIIEYTEPFGNVEELELWLAANKNKKHIVLIPKNNNL